MTLRRITSLTTLLSFILMLITSIVLYITPQGKVAYWSNWKLGGLGKEDWGALHTNLGLLFLIAGIIHTLLNWKPIMNYLKNRAQELKVFTADFNIALGLTLVITIMSLFGLPPVNAIQHFNEALKEAAAEEYGDPPYGHAEISPLKTFCKRMGINPDEAKEKLQAAGMESVFDESTLKEIAAINDTTPQAVYDLIKPSAEEFAEQGLPDSPPAGFGRRALAGICDEYALDQEAAVDAFKAFGMEVTPEASMKENAEQNNTDPHALYEILKTLEE